MLRLSSPDALNRLISDIHTVLSLAEKEFEKVEYRPDYARSKQSDVCRFRFWLSRRRQYYKSVYPSIVCVFDTLTMVYKLPFNDFAFTRFTVESVTINGEHNYVLTLWY